VKLRIWPAAQAGDQEPCCSGDLWFTC